MSLATGQATLAGVVQISQLVYMLIPLLLTLRRKCLSRYTFEVLYLCLVLSSNSLMKIDLHVIIIILVALVFYVLVMFLYSVHLDTIQIVQVQASFSHLLGAFTKLDIPYIAQIQFS